jgi:integrase
MNDLATVSKEFQNLQQKFPNTRIVDCLRRASELFDSINSFEDVERLFLRGAGLSGRTYERYLLVIRKFYSWSKGKHPFQVTLGDIEAYYDAQLAGGDDLDTMCVEIAALKRFFQTIEDKVPVFTSPFREIPEKLRKKFARKKTGNRTKKTLTPDELERLLAVLASDGSIEGRRLYAAAVMLATSGLRASELLQIRWKDIEEDPDGALKASFIGKGGRYDEQELQRPAVEACKSYFRRAFGRDPGPDDHLLYTLAEFSEVRPISYDTLRLLVIRMGEIARAAGIVRRELTWSPHMFRRCYATTLYRVGMGLKAIQAKTRHRSMDTLLQHYIHDEEPAAPYLQKLFGPLFAVA